MQNNRITICACASRTFIDKETVMYLSSTLRNKGYEVTVLPDLCKDIMQKIDNLSDVNSGIVLACYPRAVRSLFDWAGLEAKKIIDIRNSTPDKVLSEFPVLADVPEKQSDKLSLDEIRQFPVETGTDAWYPVLDKERCIECGKCHDFCLFGVYTVENKKVKVTNPQNCKNNCPACARMCPSKAIVFPKYEKSPINGGTEEEETFNSEEMDQMYRERLRIRLQQRRNSVSLLKGNK